MVLKFNKTVLGDDWFKTFTIFRLNSESFLDRRKLTRDAFCLDVLKDLYSDHVEIQNKIQLLLLLQEFSSHLITDINLLEQITESLTNLYNTLGKKPEKCLLKSQILITILTILLTVNLDQDISGFIIKIKIFLLEIIYENSEDPVIISSACSCLEELETFYPGILQNEIENILLACERETSPAFQSYALLLDMCAKNVSTNQEICLTEDNSDMISTSSYQMSPVISNLLELYPLMTNTARYRVLRSLIDVVKNTSELSPKTFKLYFNNLSFSSDVPFLHLAFELQDAFGSDLLSVQEEKLLLKQLITLSTHPGLTSSHKLMFLDWLKHRIISQHDVFSSLTFSDLKTLLPNPFDGPLTQEKKAQILSLCLPSNCEQHISGEFLNEAIDGLVKCSLLPGGTKAAPSLFRTLYVYFSSQTSENISNFIYKLLTDILKRSLHLTPYALSFLDAARSEYKNKKFHEKALDHMIEHVLSIPLKQFFANLEYYLNILENASLECASICRPRAVLRLLQKLLNSKELNIKNNWCIGNCLLSLCRTLMKHHDVQIFYYDLAEVLCLITLQFQDTDVKDRAKIYYSMLTSLSKQKVQTIFTLHASEMEVKKTLDSFVTGGESLQFAFYIQKLSKPVLQMIRAENRINLQKCEWPYSADFIPNVSEIYLKYLNSHESYLQLPFILKLIPNLEDKPFDVLYGIVITTLSEPVCKEISVIEVPILTKASESSNLVTLKLLPVESQPLTLHFKVEFTGNNGFSYSCNLQSVVLNIDDLFLPLPVPENYKHCASSWRLVLFNNLWENFMKKIKSRDEDTKCCYSVFAMKIYNEEFSNFVERKWQNNIVSKLSTLEYYVAMYLPPQNHLLLKISIINDEPFVKMLVDNVSTLPWITLYLQKINEVY